MMYAWIYGIIFFGSNESVDLSSHRLGTFGWLVNEHNMPVGYIEGVKSLWNVDHAYSYITS